MAFSEQLRHRAMTSSETIIWMVSCCIYYNEQGVNYQLHDVAMSHLNTPSHLNFEDTHPYGVQTINYEHHCVREHFESAFVLHACGLGHLIVLHL